APRRGAKVEHAGSGGQVDQPGGQARRHVLHPPAAVVVAGQLFYRPIADFEPHGIGQQRGGAKRFEQCRVSVAQRQVEGGAGQQGLGEGGNRRPAIGVVPVPAHRIREQQREGGLPQHFGFGLGAAQGGVHQLGEVGGAGSRFTASTARNNTLWAPISGR